MKKTAMIFAICFAVPVTAQPFKTEDDCYRFLETISVTTNAFLTSVDANVDLDTIDENSPILKEMQSAGQSLFDLRRETAVACVALRPAN